MCTVNSEWAGLAVACRYALRQSGLEVRRCSLGLSAGTQVATAAHSMDALLKRRPKCNPCSPSLICGNAVPLQSGASRDFFEAWCEDARNACIICDFAVQVRGCVLASLNVGVYERHRAGLHVDGRQGVDWCSGA